MSDCHTSTNPLVRKLCIFAQLESDDCRLIEDLTADSRPIDRRIDLIREGDSPSNVFLIMSGFACRYKLLPNGVRHIMAYLLPGDFCDLHVFILKKMDHSIGTLSKCQVVEIPRQRIFELTSRPAIARALWMATMVDEATLREWLVNIGGRSATERVAHLLCELLYRLRAVGLADGDRYGLPITQSELADTMGLSDVHLNRVLQRLRSDELVAFDDGDLVIRNLQRLSGFAGFNANYLHLDQVATS